jgi:Bacterial dnaA protein helix-turn-helix
MNVTPTQLAFHEARKARLQRMAAKAFRKVEIKEEPELQTAIPVNSVKDWVEKQKQLPIQGRCWFQVIDIEDIEPVKPGLPTLHQIRQAVEEHFSVSTHDLCSTIRGSNELAYIRHIAFWLCRFLTYKSYPKIGKFVGNRDHTTILHGVNKTIFRMREDDMTAAHIAAIKEKLGVVE